MKKISAETAKSIGRVMVAKAIADALIEGIENAGDLTMKQKVALHAGGLMAYRDAADDLETSVDMDAELEAFKQSYQEPQWSTRGEADDYRRVIYCFGVEELK